MNRSMRKGKDSDKDSPPARRVFARRITLVFLVLILIIITIIPYNFYLQNQLNHINRQTGQLSEKLKKIESNQIEDISIRQLSEKLEFVMGQQQINLASTQEMIDYMTFTFTLIGVFFLLVSGYFVYRQQKSEQREDEGWLMAKQLLELVTESQQFVVQAQADLQRQRRQQRLRQKRTKKHVQDTVVFLNSRANILVAQFARDTISQGINFTRLVDISNRIDNVRFQLQVFELSFDLNCYFLKAVYEYIIGNYNAAKEEFDRLINERKEKVLNDAQKKQLSLCYYYRGLIEYNVQEKVDDAERFINLAVEQDPQIKGPDFKSMLLRAEVSLKLKKPVAFSQFEDVVRAMDKMSTLTDTQRRLQSYAYLGMVYCKVLEGGKKFLRPYHNDIGRIDGAIISDVIGWLDKSKDSHLYTLLTFGQLAVVFEETGREVGLEPSERYFSQAYDWLEQNRPHEVKEETRAKILAYTVKLVCEKCTGKSTDDTRFILRDLLADPELKAVYSIFSKVNVSRKELQDELQTFDASISFA